MIRAIIGRPGGGKSYHAIEIILEELQQARVVVTNIPVYEDKLAKDYPLGKLVKATDEDLETGIAFQQNPGAVFVLDEVRRYIPSGITQDKLNRAWDQLISEHRHYEDWHGRSSEVVLLTQCTSQIAKSVRTLIDVTCYLEKLDKVGLKTGFKRICYSGCQAIDRRDKQAEIGTKNGRYQKKVYQYYASHSKAQGESKYFAELRDGNKSNIFLSGKLTPFYLSLAALVICGTAIASFLSDNQEKQNAAIAAQLQKEREENQTIEQPPQPKPRRNRAPIQGQTRYSGYWKAWDRCGAYDQQGNRVEIQDCRTLEAIRIVAQDRPQRDAVYEGLGGPFDKYVGNQDD